MELPAKVKGIMDTGYGGDVNKDCYVNSLDLGTLNYYWGADIGRDVGDVDHNGATDVFDILLIKYYYGSARGDVRYKGYLDLNKDGVIDNLDITVWVASYHVTFHDVYRGWIDLNKDGIITSADWNIVLNNWGRTC